MGSVSDKESMAAFLAEHFIFHSICLDSLCDTLSAGWPRASGVTDGDLHAPDLCCEEGSVEDEVLSIIGRHFKEPHLLKTEVLSEVSRGNVRKADRFITLYGYYRLVNMFRLEYARLYKLSNPDAIQDLIASESGFTSRVTFYKARKSVGEISEEVSSRVKKLF